MDAREAHASEIKRLERELEDPHVSMNRADQASVVSRLTLAKLEETKWRIVCEEMQLKWEARIRGAQSEVEMIEGKAERTKRQGETAIKELERVLNKLMELRKENEKE